MKRIYLSMIWWLLASVGMAQAKKGQPAARYDMAVHFNSICCGPPDPAFLQKFLKQFAKTNKARPKAWLLGGCGREGEFKILLSHNGLNAKSRTRLMAQLTALVAQQNTANKSSNSSSGNIELQQNPSASDWEGCRATITTWKY